MFSTLALGVWLLGAEPPRFEKHMIDAFPAGYQVAVADINGDGRPDVIALSTEADRVDWYENPGWQRHPIYGRRRTSTWPSAILDGNGRPAIALASGFYFNESRRGGEIELLRQPANPDGLWPRQLIAVDPVVHRLRWADVEGNGRPVLIHAPIFGPGSEGPQAPRPSHLWAFRQPRQPGQPWEVWKIDESLTVLHGICIADLDGDGRDAILTASFEGIHRFDLKGRGREARWRKVQLAAAHRRSTTSRVPPAAQAKLPSSVSPRAG